MMTGDDDYDEDDNDDDDDFDGYDNSLKSGNFNL